MVIEVPPLFLGGHLSMAIIKASNGLICFEEKKLFQMSKNKNNFQNAVMNIGPDLTDYNKSLSTLLLLSSVEAVESPELKLEFILEKFQHNS